ncbi:MAG: hypothetical protein U0172_13340 [Nitrospiraceae bacterium]
MTPLLLHWPLLAIRKLVPWGVVLACLVGTAACAGKGPVYQEDHQRYVAIDTTLEGLRRAYVERNLDAFRALLLPSEGLDRVEREVLSDVEAFKQIGLDWTVERILIDGDIIDVYLHWQGQWRREAADPPLRERGQGRMQFAGAQVVLLKSVEGNLPFGMSGRAAGFETPSTQSSPSESSASPSTERR